MALHSYGPIIVMAEGSNGSNRITPKELMILANKFKELDTDDDGRAPVFF